VRAKRASRAFNQSDGVHCGGNAGHSCRRTANDGGVRIDHHPVRIDAVRQRRDNWTKRVNRVPVTGNDHVGSADCQAKIADNGLGWIKGTVRAVNAETRGVNDPAGGEDEGRQRFNRVSQRLDRRSER
jgi:hypothetical protein